MELKVDAGDAAAGDLVGGERLAVFVGEVEEAVRLGGLFQPVDEAFISAWMTSCAPRKLMRMIMSVMSGIPRWPSERSQRRN